MLATALSERIADAIVLAVMSAIVLLALPSPPGWFAGAATPVAIVGLSGAAAIAVLPLLGPLGRTVIERAPLPGSLRPRLVAAMEQGLRGLRGFHDARRLSGFWRSRSDLGAGRGRHGARWRGPGAAIEPAAAFLLIAGLSVGSALPSTPGYIGIYQFVAVSVLTPFGFSRAEAIAFILVTQALGYVVMDSGAHGSAYCRDRPQSAATGRSRHAGQESSLKPDELSRKLRSWAVTSGSICPILG